MCIKSLWYSCILQRRAVFDALCMCTKPEKLKDLYVFVCGPSTFKNDDPKLRLLKEYHRLLGKGSFHASSTAIGDGLSLSNNWWRITSINSSYTLCPTYPFALIVPKSIWYYLAYHQVHNSQNFLAVPYLFIGCATSVIIFAY